MAHAVVSRNSDLIDTLWNVKFAKRLLASVTSSRFNRYIVECKGERGLCAESSDGDLIDTLWNVKTK